MRNVPDKILKKIKTRVLCPITFFFGVENRAIYEKMWKNIVEQDRPQITIWRMRIACWVSNATNTHSEYVLPIAFPLQQLLKQHSSVLGYTHSECLVIFYFNLVEPSVQI